MVCAHNEEDYITACLRAILEQTATPSLIILIADRCTDGTVAIAKAQLAKTRSLIIEKNHNSWKNPISENLQLGLNKATGEALVIVDADMTIPPNFLSVLLPQLKRYGSVSAVVCSDPRPSLLNRLVAIWERSYRFSPLGDQPRGGARVVSLAALTKAGGFRDVYAWETDLDIRLRKLGFKVRLDRRVRVLHRRKMTITHSISYQINAGKARRELGVSPLRTLLHSIIRLRPFVIYGYLTSKQPAPAQVSVSSRLRTRTGEARPCDSNGDFRPSILSVAFGLGESS